jgi:hypothetical protein
MGAGGVVCRAAWLWPRPIGGPAISPETKAMATATTARPPPQWRPATAVDLVLTMTPGTFMRGGE